MGGKNNKNKQKQGLTAAKRKENARKPLLEKQERKETVKRIYEIHQEEQTLEKEAENLSELGKQTKTMRENCDRMTKENNDKMRAAIFADSIKGKRETCSNAEYLKSLFCVYNFNQQLKSDLLKAERKYGAWNNAYVDMLSKEKIEKEKCELLLPSSSHNIEVLKAKKKDAELRLRDMKTTIRTMTELENERRDHHSEILTLEEYLASNHNYTSKNIEELRKILKTVNEQSRKIQKELENRHSINRKIANEIKQNGTASVEDHERYKSIVKENKKMIAQLKELIKERDSIVDEKNRAVMEIERERERVYEEDKGRIEIEEQIKQLRLQHDQNRGNAIREKEILETAKEQNWVQDLALRHEKDKIAVLEEKIASAKEEVNIKRKKYEEVKDYNEKISKYVVQVYNDGHIYKN